MPQRQLFQSYWLSGEDGEWRCMRPDGGDLVLLLWGLRMVVTEWRLHSSSRNVL